MKFVTNLSAERFNEFAANHKKNHFLQSYQWGVFKSKSPDWSFDAVGNFVKNDSFYGWQQIH